MLKVSPQKVFTFLVSIDKSVTLVPKYISNSLTVSSIKIGVKSGVTLKKVYGVGDDTSKYLSALLALDVRTLEVEITYLNNPPTIEKVDLWDFTIKFAISSVTVMGFDYTFAINKTATVTYANVTKTNSYYAVIYDMIKYHFLRNGGEHHRKTLPPLLYLHLTQRSMTLLLTAFMTTRTMPFAL